MSRPIPIDRLGPAPLGVAGLPTAAVAERRRRWGANEVLEVPTGSWRGVVRDTVRDPMIWFLLGTGVAYAVLGERLEAVTLFVAALPLVAMDAYLHRRTRASLAALSATIAARARVVRDGTTADVPSEDLVPGDLVVVEAGEPFPADGLIVGGSDVQVDESALTGESYPARKRVLATLPADGEAVADDVHWGMAGTRVLSGHAQLRVAFTGRETLYGEIVREAVQGDPGRTPLQVAVGNLVSVLLVVAGVICAVVGYVRWQQGHGLLDALVSAATLAVAALPEEFPVALTVFLGVGVYRLARRKALVRRAVSVETIGRVTCICSDKTGTITEGRLRVGHVLPAAETSERRLLELAAMASRAETRDPMDVAILDACGPIGEPPAVLGLYPFTEDRRRETAVLRTATGVLAVMKGAPEVVFAATTLTTEARAAWNARVEALAADAHKVIACAQRPVVETWPGGEPDRGYTLAGLLALEDPVREGVVESVARCRAAGIHVVMVTGDHPATAAAVAREIGLGGAAPRVVLGEALDGWIADTGARPADVDVVARARPMQKLALVRALQAAGERVAVTGDGVNDVPALQAADVGLAMGRRGTQSAREVASIVLLDDNFRTIVGAIAEGRQLFRNLQLSFLYLLTIHVPLVLTATVVPLAGLPLLYLPIHIVWLEMVIHPTAMLVFQELPATDRLVPVERRRRARFFTAAEWVTIAAMGLLLGALVLALYRRSLGPLPHDLAHARAMALATMSLASAMLTVALSGLRTRLAVVVAAATVAAALMLLQVPALATVLHVSPLHWDDWGLAVAGTMLAVGGPLLAARLAAGTRPRAALDWMHWPQPFRRW